MKRIIQIMLKAALPVAAIIVLGVVLVYGGWITLPDRVVPDIGPRCEVPLIVDPHDQNANGVPDALDLVAGARSEVAAGTIYNASYCAGGYPPEGQGACTDVVWRAFRQAGYDLKAMVDDDIRSNPEWYGLTGSNPDPNIDFRRCPNLIAYFSHHGITLTTEYKPWDAENLQQWQPGDLVFFDLPKDHVAVVSDQRRRDGVPLIIHNAGPTAAENDALTYWPTPIIGHYRFVPDK